MTEVLVTKAIVKLPKTRLEPMMEQEKYQDYLVSDKLYFDHLPPHTVNKHEIQSLFESCQPKSIYLNTNLSCGYIQFHNKEMADCAYTLLNGSTTQSGVKIQLKISSSNYPEPEATAEILQIKNLPNNINNNNALYELFRPFGPMILCKVLVEQDSTFKGSALVQYFNPENAQLAESIMNNKAVQDNVISVFPFVSTHTFDNAHNRQNIRSDESSLIDYTNLYIKNLDLNVKSADLFNYFRKFGRIISARVMKNTQTKQSKGFGFVSFSKADEALQAKQEMNGVHILSKPIVVAFHEPKKSREPPPPLDASRVAASVSPIPTNTYYPITKTMSHDSRRMSTMSIHPRPQHFSTTTTMVMEGNNQYMYHQKPYDYSTPLKRGKSNNTIMYPPVSSIVSPHDQLSPISQYPENKPTFRRRGSFESITSVMTKTSSKTKRHTILKAIVDVDTTGMDQKQLSDIVDMMLTLKKKDLATCLFNKVFLKAKIKQAKDALDIFDEQQYEDDEDVIMMLEEEQPYYQQYSPPITTIHQKVSKAIPIVAPPESTKKKDENIGTFLSTLKDLPSHEQKQLLGDRLFPLVKATGIKHAPRITIQLLDNIPLHELAYSMNDQEKLKRQISQLPSK